MSDGRDRRLVTHEQVGSGVTGIALDYEDCNDATTLRADPVLKACCDVDPNGDRSSRTLGREP